MGKKQKTPEEQLLEKFKENAPRMARQLDRSMRRMHGKPEPPIHGKQIEQFVAHIRGAIPKARDMLDTLERNLNNADLLKQIKLSEGNGVVIIVNPEHVTGFEIQVDHARGVGIRVENTPSKDADTLSLTASKKNKVKK